jgi:sugar phosphate isomerase/epimerase
MNSVTERLLMTMYSRREFGRVFVAGVPLAAAIASVRLGADGQLALGVSTSSFRDLPRVTGRDNVDAVIGALQAVRAKHIELALANIEPAPPSTAPFMGGSPAYPRRVVLTPEQIAATNSQYRIGLRMWRGQTPLSSFDTVRGAFAAAGITLHACAIAYDESFTDDEIDATFRQAKALGVTTVSSPLTMAVAARLVPFAERHQLFVAIHNQVDGNSAGSIATPDLNRALALSSAFKLALDIGNLTASNCDAVAELREHHGRVSHVLVKDRLRNGGASQPFGEGDTPIAGVLDVLRTSARSIPALVEYDYVGLHSPVEEVTASVAYMAQTAK